MHNNKAVRGSVMLCACVAIILMFCTSTVSAGNWLFTPPIVTDHTNWESITEDASGLLVEIDNIETEFNFLDLPGSPGDPIEIQEVENLKFIWEIAYNLSAKLTLYSNYLGARAEMHANLSIFNSGQWVTVYSNWVCIESLIKGQTVSEVGALHVYHAFHNYEPGDNYRVYVNITGSHMNPNNWVIHQPHIFDCYYRII